jgi:LysM repeat protein
MQTRLYITLLLMVIMGNNLSAQKSADVLYYIDTYKELAINEMKRTGIPAAIKIAQGIHETSAGQSDLVKRSNNHFGIKCKSSWLGEKVYHDDDARGECFRSYARPEDSYMDHSDFLKNNQRYAFLFTLDPTDYEGWAYGLKKAGYATNIRYSQILIKIIKDYNLQDYTLIALGRMKPGDNILVANTKENVEVIAAPGVDVAVTEEEKQKRFPAGIFEINDTKVIYAPANTAWLSIAEAHQINLNRLWDFNDLENDADILREGQLVYLQRKRKTGSAAYHIVKQGETLYDIAQQEGIRLSSLLDLNKLDEDMKPGVGEKLYLQQEAPSRPALAHEKNLILAKNSNSTLPASPLSNYATHIVASKETLYGISKKYGVEMEKIMDWNKLNGMNLRVGQELIIYRTDTTN